MSAPPGPWTEQRIDEARTLWLAGVSAANIAKHFNNIMSRNAVVGKLCRMGIQRRIPHTPKESRPKAEYNSARKTRVIKPKPMPELPDPSITGLTVMQIPIRGACRWPISGSGADLVMCGQRCAQDATYCGRCVATHKPYSPTSAREKMIAVKVMRAAVARGQ